MGGPWQYQIRVYLPEPLAGIARTNPDAPVLRPLTEILHSHTATLVSQLDAFDAYVAQAEKENADDPLYRWTGLPRLEWTPDWKDQSAVSAICSGVM